MRVNIRHEEETKGLLKKKTIYVIHFGVDFSEEEMAVIEKNNMAEMILIDLPPAATTGVEQELKVSQLWYKGRGWTWYFNSPLEAREFEEELKGKLALLKEEIEHNSGYQTGSLSFEL